jgi:hypothetical protein
MKKNIFDKQAAHEVVKRIQKVQPSAKPRWGCMTEVEMFFSFK